MCVRAKLSLVVAWSARGQHVCVSVEEFTGLRPLMRMLYPMGHYCSTGFVRSVSLASVKKGGNGLLPFGEYVASSGLLVLASPCFSKTLVYFQRAHPPFVLYFTATFISFSCCLIRARSPV